MPDWQNSILTGDCLELMDELPGGEFQAVVTDPPYSSGARKESEKMRGGYSGRREVQPEEWFDGDSMTVDSYQWFIRRCAIEWNRLLDVGGSALVFTDWRMMNYVRQSCESVGFRTRNCIVWDKGHFGMGHGFRHQYELILHFTKGGFDAEVLDTGNVLQHARPSEDRHPTEKPVSLLEDLLRVVASRGDCVLDPFAGSGSTGVAAQQLGLEFVGIERDPGHAETARNRLSDADTQSRIGDIDVDGE